MEIKYICEVCREAFDYRGDCYEHEIECGKEKSFMCDRCGEVAEWNIGDELAFAMENGCWSVNLGVAEYGSRLDGCRVDFDLCDSCLVEWVEDLSPEAQSMMSEEMRRGRDV